MGYVWWGDLRLITPRLSCNHLRNSGTRDALRLVCLRAGAVNGLGFEAGRLIEGEGGFRGGFWGEMRMGEAREARGRKFLRIREK